MTKDIFEELSDSVLTLEPDEVKNATQKALEIGTDPLDIIEKGFSKALKIVGDAYEEGEFFLMELMAAAECVKKSLDELLKPLILEKKSSIKSLGVVVIGTVKGDIHEIGKNIIASFLFAAGFEVHNIGNDIPVEDFVEKAREVNADVVGASALLSTTLPEQEKLVEAFEKAGLRDKVKLIFGGAPVTEQWVEDIGGDGFASTPLEVVNLVKDLLEIR